MGLLFKCFYLKTCRKLHHVIPFLKVTSFFFFFKCLAVSRPVSNKLIIQYEKSHLHLAVANYVGSLFNHIMVTFDPLATAHMQ